MFGAVKLLYPLDDDAAGAGSFDLGPHFVQKVGEIHDLGLFRGAVDDGGPLGEHGSHHDVIGAEHGRTEFAGHRDHRAFEFRGENLDVASHHAHCGAEGLESPEVEIDRPVADDAAPRHGDRGLPLAAQERTQDANRGAHLADNLVRSGGGDFFRLHGDRAAGPLHGGAQVVEDLEHVMHVREIGNMMDDTFLLREQGGGEDRQGGVLRPGDIDRPGELPTTMHENFIHKLRRGIG